MDWFYQDIIWVPFLVAAALFFGGFGGLLVSLYLERKEREKDG